MSSIATDRTFVQELYYNGYRFNDSTRIVNYSVKGNKSASERYYSDATYSLTVTFYEQFDSLAAADRQMDAVVEKLTTAAGPLRFNGRAFGKTQINIQGGKKDTRFGPWPRIDGMKPKGCGRGVEVTWTVEWTTVNCADGITEGLQPLDFCWDLGIKYDRAGNETRTITGFLQIPATRFPAKNRKLPYTADQLRERLLPPLPQGYDRPVRDFKINYAKTRIDFTIEDRQIVGAVLPVNVIDGTASRRLSQTPGKPLEWSGSYQAEYHIAPGRPITSALNSYFLELEQFWSGWVAANPIFALIGAGVSAVTGGIRPVLRPWAFDFSDPVLYNGLLRVGVNAQFRVYAATMRQMIERGGLWTALPRGNNAWASWIESVPTHANARGINEVVFTPNEDSISSLCQPASFEVDLRGNPSIPKRVSELRTDGALDPILKRLFPAPTATSSWLDYRHGVHVESDSGKVIGKVLPSAPLVEPRTAPEFNPFLGVLPLGTGTKAAPPSTDVLPTGGSANYPGGTASGGTARGGTFIQQRTAPTVFVTLVGDAQRVGFPIPEPSILTYGGASVEYVGRADADEGFAQEIVGADAMGNPLYVAKWRKRYVVVDADTRVTRIQPVVPPNPFFRAVT